MRYSTKQVKDSGIFTIFVGGGWGGVMIFGTFGGKVGANLPLLRVGYCVIFHLAKLIFRPPHPDNYCTVPYFTRYFFYKVNTNKIIFFSRALQTISRYRQRSFLCWCFRGRAPNAGFERHKAVVNRPFPSFFKPLPQSESWSSSSHLKMRFHSLAN